MINFKCLDGLYFKMKTIYPCGSCSRALQTNDESIDHANGRSCCKHASFSPRKRRRIPPASSAGVVLHAREVPGAPDLGLRRPPWRHGAAALAPFSSRGPARARLPEEDEGVLRSGPHESDPAADKTLGWTVFQIPSPPGRYRPPLERLLGCMPRRRGTPESRRAPGRWLPVK